MSWETLSFLMMGGALGFTLWPLFFGWEKTKFAPSDLLQRRKILEDQRNTLYSNLKDLEMEFRMGRLDERDYEDLKTDYEKEAGEILRELDGLGETAGVKAVGEELFAPPYCSQCGSRLRPRDRFCSQCGSTVT